MLTTTEDSQTEVCQPNNPPSFSVSPGDAQYAMTLKSEHNSGSPEQSRDVDMVDAAPSKLKSETPQTLADCNDVLQLEAASSPVTSLGTADDQNSADELSPVHSPMMDVSPKSLAAAAGITSPNQTDVDTILPTILPRALLQQRDITASDLAGKTRILEKRFEELHDRICQVRLRAAHWRIQQQKEEQQKQKHKPASMTPADLASTEQQPQMKPRGTSPAVKRRKLMPNASRRRRDAFECFGVEEDPYATDDESADELLDHRSRASLHPVEMYRRYRDDVAARWMWLQRRQRHTQKLAKACDAAYEQSWQQRNSHRSSAPARAQISSSREMPRSGSNRELCAVSPGMPGEPFRPKTAHATLDTLASRAAGLDRSFHPTLSFMDELPPPVDRVVECARKKRIKAQANVLASAVRQPPAVQTVPTSKAPVPPSAGSDGSALPSLSQHSESSTTTQKQRIPSGSSPGPSNPHTSEKDRRRQRGSDKRLQHNSSPLSTPTRTRKSSEALDDVILPSSLVPTRVDTSVFDVPPIPTPSWSIHPDDALNSASPPLSEDTTDAAYHARHAPFEDKERQRYLGVPAASGQSDKPQQQQQNAACGGDHKASSGGDAPHHRSCGKKAAMPPANPTMLNAAQRTSWKKRKFPLKGDDLQDLDRLVPKDVASGPVYQIVVPSAHRKSDSAAPMGPVRVVLKLGPATPSSQ